MIVYIKPGCSKCAEAIDLLEKNNCEFQLRDYLQIPPSVEELKELVYLLGGDAHVLVRKSETLFQEIFAAQNLDNEGLIKMLSENPELIQRPIIIDGDRAMIGRPPMTILTFLKSSG